MNRLIIPFLTLLVGLGLVQKANAQQNNPYRDSIVQLYGVVMTADSLRGIPSASVIVEGKGRGTITSYDGVFSIAVMKGDRITFSSIGFKNNSIQIPLNLESNQYSVIQLLVSDTAYLPATILKPRPTKEQFERDFLNNRFPDDAYEIARKNTDEATRRILLNSLPADGREAVNFQLRQQTNKYYYAGQVPPMNIMNPAAWADFITAWKRGDFKRKK
ncbi:carboxypeptidase-like regulatory domain-containing protein [Sediminibacterium sp.]|uniref:carboxypeptidase-like regulatory domain-containing protein n=1 Tax=Sediminibacterium sp. TaxID=1917865 RepID=UPI0026005EC7|nr:carboxypeptidase-like regulatory domain-containing protein [Sediminibacterium sp.]MDO8996009.1 carboxypeptidase-like regulatory domain-containing protein [Sediminibacterium sp.]MDP1973628.1 carboxypeptidase-like regulatory domain-containing protein [Sediminibacterium sp.]MDP2420728.1 carboxypeptidase-like regulatory domain-containing protein [Sediminibacterium sp.]